jgi:hypothetical protein
MNKVNQMNRKCLAVGISILAIVLLTLTSFINVVGYQTVQSSNQSVIKERINQRELLFQTIVDIANNKEIQRIILKSQLSREGFFNPDVRFSVFNTPVLTKNQLKQMYIIGFLLSKVISKSKIYTMIKQYQLINQRVQKEITAVIEKDAALNGKITQLSELKCDCGNDSGIISWTYPVICFIANIMCFIGFFLSRTLGHGFGDHLLGIGSVLIMFFNCPI